MFPNEANKEQYNDFYLRWDIVEGAEYYYLQVSADSVFDNLIVNKDSIKETQYFTRDLSVGKYFWKVKAINSDNRSQWSEHLTFEYKESNSIERTSSQQDYYIEAYPNPFYNFDNNSF